MKKFMIMAMITLFGIAGLCQPVFSADVAKIGVLNFEKILKESSKGKLTQNQLQEKGQELKGKLEKEKAELEEMSQNYEKEALLLSAEKKKEKEREFRIRVNDLKKMQEDFARELKTMEIELIKEIQTDVFKITDQIGKDEGYMMIMERKTAGIIYMPDQMDITDRVIEAYNKQMASKK